MQRTIYTHQKNAITEHLDTQVVYLHTFTFRLVRIVTTTTTVDDLFTTSDSRKSFRVWYVSTVFVLCKTGNSENARSLQRG